MSGSVRRKRYERDENAPCSLTPRKRAMLRHLAECWLLSLPQLAELEGLDEKAARKHLRPLYDAGYIDIIAVPRAALADAEDGESDLTLVYGSAPNLYRLSRAGLKLLYELGDVEKETRDRLLPPYNALNSLFLAHEVQVRDVRVFLARTTREAGGKLIRWQDRGEAERELRGERKLTLRPDAFLTFHLPSERTLVGLVEVDRGTEKGVSRWRDKVGQYHTLFNLPPHIRQSVLGFENARILVIVPNEARRRWLRELLRKEIRQSETQLLKAFYICLRKDLLSSTTLSAIWQRLEGEEMVPLVPPQLFREPVMSPGSES